MNEVCRVKVPLDAQRRSFTFPHQVLIPKYKFFSGSDKIGALVKACVGRYASQFRRGFCENKSVSIDYENFGCKTLDFSRVLRNP